MSVRESFVHYFGEKQAQAIETAAKGHKNGVHDNTGSDPFKWALLICIGSECLTRFAEYHGITVEESTIKEWARNYGELASHDGDYDFLAAMAGAYADWVV